MSSRVDLFKVIREKMELAGFLFESEQTSHHQYRKEKELKFTHPQLVKKLEEDGFSVQAKKFYVKALTDDENSEIGLVTGKSSPLGRESFFVKPNSMDTFNDNPAWVNRTNLSALDNLLESIKKYLKGVVAFSEEYPNTFLFTWNPDKWEWKDLSGHIQKIEALGHVEERWNCGRTKQFKEGDRIFLMRLGSEPRGIVGSGYINSPIYTAPHWDGTDKKIANYVDISFDVLIDPDKNRIFDTSLLESIDVNSIQRWNPQQSGISIKPELVGPLEKGWFDFINENKYFEESSPQEVSNRKEEMSFREGKSIAVTQNRYERNPEARRRCLAHHGCSCGVCGFDFEEHFGEVGTGFIHVHHIKPISEIGKEYSVDPLKDLIPVCPNCHAMIHSRRPAYSLEEIKGIRKANIGQ